MEENLALDDDVDVPEENQKKVFAVTWCMIYSVLGLIGALIIVALIPLYTPNHGVEALRNTDALSDLLKIQYQTNYHYVGTRVTVQINKQALSRAVDQSFGFTAGTVVTQLCEFVQGTVNGGGQKRRRRQDTTLEIGANGTDLFDLYAQLHYPPYCFTNAMCKSLFRQRCLNKIRRPGTHDMEVPLLDGEVLRFEARVLSVTEHSDGIESTPTIASTLLTTTTATSVTSTATESTTIRVNVLTSTVGIESTSREPTTTQSITAESTDWSTATATNITTVTTTTTPTTAATVTTTTTPTTTATVTTTTTPTTTTTTITSTTTTTITTATGTTTTTIGACSCSNCGYSNGTSNYSATLCRSSYNFGSTACISNGTTNYNAYCNATACGISGNYCTCTGCGCSSCGGGTCNCGCSGCACNCGCTRTCTGYFCY